MKLELTTAGLPAVELTVCNHVNNHQASRQPSIAQLGLYCDTTTKKHSLETLLETPRTCYDISHLPHDTDSTQFPVFVDSYNVYSFYKMYLCENFKLSCEGAVFWVNRRLLSACSDIFYTICFESNEVNQSRVLSC